MLEKIGTKRIERCFDGKDHETTLMDYLVRLTGNTYHKRALIHEEEMFHWDDSEKAWFGNVDSENEVNRLAKKFSGTGINMAIKPIYRISDAQTNPIEY